MSNYFEAKRFMLVLKRDELMRWRSLTVTALTILGVTALLTLFQSVTEQSVEAQVGLYGAFLFLGGYLVASAAFKAMHSREAVHDWLMLPASTEEKFLSRLLSTTLGYWIFITLIFTLGVLLGQLFQFILAGRTGVFFNPLSRRVLLLFPHYLISQSVFVAGAAFFRKHQFLKSILFLSILGMVVGFFTLLMVRLLFGEFFASGINFEFDFSLADPSFRATRRVGEVLLSVIKIVYFYLLAPFCWITAYFRVREAEVRYAV